ncbi:MAG: hypothetical protein QOD75_1188 [Blastocatellia bacterium]|nr:hypothetical protein [Blastocatellia bacterium]
MSSNIFYRLTLWLLLALVPCAVPAQQAAPATSPSPSVSAANKLQLVIEGKVINVHDGDTITVLDQDNKKFHIRLQGIDAPELKQEAGAVSQQNLSRMVLGKQVTIVWTKVDKYRRTVGTIMLDGRDINIEQVKAGMAWHFKKYEDEQSPEDRRTYAAAEQSARAAQLGLWKSPATPTAPGDWRQEVKAKRWGPPPPVGTIIGNSNSKKYHRPDCAGYRDMAETNRVFFKTVEEAEAAGYRRAGNCPPAEQVVIAQTMPTQVTIQPIPTQVAPPQPAVNVPVRPQINIPAPASTPESAKVSVATTPAPVASTVTVPRPGIQAPTTAAQEPVIGNKNSKIFHLPGCAGYNRVSEKNQVKFNSAAEAEAAGYRLAKNCSTDGKGETAAPKAVTPVAPLTNAAPTEPVAAEEIPESKVIGNKSSKVYHFPGCPGYDEVTKENQVEFESAAKAEAAGFKLAGNCSADMTPPVEPRSTAPESTTTPPPADTKPSAAPLASPATEGRVVGNKNSKIYHLPACSGYTKVSEKNRVYFDSEAEAEKAGYRKAKNCS